MVRYFTYSQYHGKPEPTGSDYIRAMQVIKYWPEAELYKYGENPEVLIFQKVFMSADYQFPKHFQGKKILDICDPMWLEDCDVVATAHEMDAVTCSSEGLAVFLRQFHKNVHVIPDRFDIELIPPPKKHTKKAKTIVWFGYSHNADCLKPAVALIESLGLNLTIISNDDPIINRYGIRDKSEYYKFVKYNEATIYDELQKCDFAILPDGIRPIDVFKSNNKTIKAQLAGLPVAKTPEQVEEYMFASNRQHWFDTEYDIIKSEYDVRNSVKQMQEIIKAL